MREDKVVHSFSKNGLEEVRASLTSYRGHYIADIRSFYMDANGEWRPSRKGLAVAVSLLPALREAIERLQEAAEA